MQLDPDVPGERAPSSATSSPNSIIERKRELRAIPGSFSYNLGRRSGATAAGLALSPSHHNHSPSRSVRSTVAWIESSSAGRDSGSQRSSGLSTSDDGFTATIRLTASSYKLHGGLVAAQSPPPPPPPRRPRELAVDDDCPTFLDYQRYFAQGSSLLRCLDEQLPGSGAETDKERREAALRHHEQKRPGSKRGRRFTGGECEKRSPADVVAL